VASVDGSLSEASTAVSSAKVAVVDYGEVGRSIGIAGTIIVLGQCLRVGARWLGRVLCTQLQPY
jgi:hypothetical protein